MTAEQHSLGSVGLKHGSQARPDLDWRMEQTAGSFFRLVHPERQAD
jgi:hypothetical protein